MGSSTRAILFATAGLLWFFSLPSWALEDPPTKERQESARSQPRTQAPARTSSAPPASPTRSGGGESPSQTRTEPRRDLGSGTWVGSGSRNAQVPGYRPPYGPPHYRPPYYQHPWWGWGYRGYPFYWGGYWGPYWGSYWGDYSGGQRSVIYRGVEAGALDLDVSPEEAQVVIDGDLVGTCDDFDGYPDHLWLKEGSYQVDFFLDGYVTKSMKIGVLPGVVQRLDFSLEEGESIAPFMEGRNRDHEFLGPAEPVETAVLTEPAEPVSGDGEYVESAQSDREAARIWLQISPDDASVYLDERFLGTAEEISRLHAGMVVGSGRHLIQVVRPGFVSQEQALALEAGDEFDVRIDLSPE